MIEQFAADIIRGLEASPKTLPSKYFYDEIGDNLFVEIMDMPEYYLTRAEMEIFKNQTDSLIDSLNQSPQQSFHLLELGAGDGRKTIHLLRRLMERDYDFTYRPVDISLHAIKQLEQRLTSKLPELKIDVSLTDYFNQLPQLCSSKVPQIILFLGSNLGNFNDAQATMFMEHLSENMKSGDKLLLGLDRIKSTDIILPAYNDKAGLTARFNLNLLTRINRELNANFDLKNFQHVPEYSEYTGIAVSNLKSLCDQTVIISGVDRKFTLKSEEIIHTEISRKYNLTILSDIISKTRLRVNNILSDTNSFFYDVVLNRE